MLGKPDPKKIQQMMKKLNLNVQEIPAEMVIIKCKNKNIIISKPEVMLAEMMGRDIYQITGEVSESIPISEDDIRMVMEKTGKDRETVVQKLEELNNDLAKAIMELKEK
ncbi:MAG: nascent polypeptide-associated complex protein [Candidatus Aenigmatarchaeota archaeon]